LELELVPAVAMGRGMQVRDPSVIEHQRVDHYAGRLTQPRKSN
jgi:hypothetical protein